MNVPSTARLTRGVAPAQARPLQRPRRLLMRLALLVFPLLPALAHHRAHALVLGVTEGVTYRATDNQIEARFEPIADVMAKALRQPVTIKVLSSYDSMRAALRLQQIDVAFIHPAHVALEGMKAGGWRSVAWTSGFTEYKVSFLCAKDAKPITDWNTLAGRSLVTPDPDSITAVMTRAMLREHGLRDSAVTVKTTRYQDAVPFYVEHGFAAYGATASRGVIKSWRDGGGRTCAESRPVPIKTWLVSTRLEAPVASGIRDSLLNLSQTDSGRKALAVSTYTGFIATTPEIELALTAWLGL